jgi:hypothetical protein
VLTVMVPFQYRYCSRIFNYQAPSICTVVFWLGLFPFCFGPFLPLFRQRERRSGPSDARGLDFSWRQAVSYIIGDHAGDEVAIRFHQNKYAGRCN